MLDSDLFLKQDHAHYTPRDHATWQLLYERIQPSWERYANRRFLEGVTKLNLDPARVPRLEDVNRFLHPLTQFRAVAVRGYVPAYVFFDCLRRREFPTTITVRPPEHLDYLPEPDIFHDVCGHVPLHTDPAFAAALVRFGECARAAAAAAGSDPRRLESILRAMARFFWFSVEFGLMREGAGWKACGSGLLSSHSEIEHALDSPQVERVPFELERVIHTPFDIDRFQPLLMVIDSFEQLYEMIGRLEEWMRAGKLDRVAPGKPEVNEGDLRSFLDAAEPLPH